MIRYLADANLNFGIVSGCLRREPSMDFSVDAARLRSVPDPQVLTLCQETGRILITHDVQTMPRHFGNHLEAGHTSPGVFLVPQWWPIGEVVEELVMIWAASEAQEWVNRIAHIPLR